MSEDDAKGFFESILSTADRLNMYANELHAFYLAFLQAGFNEEQATTFTGLRFANDLQHAREAQQNGDR